jgi:diguanylate cyclase (GGDEF)-like protein
MASPFNVFLISALLCVVLLFVLCSLLRSGFPGVREWCAANAVALAAFLLYAFGQELPPLIAYEVANGAYAAATVALLAGFRRFFVQKMPWAAAGAGIAILVIAIALFHYVYDSFALRTVAVSVSQVAFHAAIAMTIVRGREKWRSQYPYAFTAAMAATVAAGNAIRAVIYVASDGQMTSLLQPSPWNLAFLSLGAIVLPVLSMGAVMMVHDKMMANAEHNANRDFLTGAWSRRAFFEISERELVRVARNGRKCSLLVLDVDKFKAINDRSGHAAGDKVLVEVVSRAETVIRGSDYFARIGGEEFAVLLPETGITGAIEVAERLRESLDAQVPVADSRGEPSIVSFTVSIGVAELREGESFTDMFQRADAALYDAKLSGRKAVMTSKTGLRIAV